MLREREVVSINPTTSTAPTDRPSAKVTKTNLFIFFIFSTRQGWPKTFILARELRMKAKSRGPLQSDCTGSPGQSSRTQSKLL
jgi:hypothetical protein